MNNGAGGLGPALAMAVLLRSRSPGRSLIVLAIFALIAVLTTLSSARLRRDTSRLRP